MNQSVTIIRTRILIGQDAFKVSKTKIVASEKRSTYTADGLRIRKEDLMKVTSGHFRSDIRHMIPLEILYIESQREEALGILSEEAEKALEAYKREALGVIAQGEKLLTEIRKEVTV